MAEADQSWLQARRIALWARRASSDPSLVVSSRCAASGAARHADEVEGRAALTFERFDAGLATSCQDCGAPIPLERLDVVLTATRCGDAVVTVGEGTARTAPRAWLSSRSAGRGR